MGVCCSSLHQSHRVLILGLDNAGKSTLFHKIISPHLPLSPIYVPTELPVVKHTKLHGVNLTLWDVSGSDTQLWRHYLTGTKGLIYVIDSSDLTRIPLAIDTLLGLISDPQLSTVSCFLILSSKEDVSHAITLSDASHTKTLSDVQTALHEKKIESYLNQRPIKVFSMTEYRQALEWFCKNL